MENEKLHVTLSNELEAGKSADDVIFKALISWPKHTQQEVAEAFRKIGYYPNPESWDKALEKKASHDRAQKEAMNTLNSFFFGK